MLTTSTMRKALQGALITLASTTAAIALLPNIALAAKSEISAKLGKPLQEAKDLMAAKKFREAIGKVKEAEAMPDKKPAEETLINEMLSYLYLQTKDYNSALNVYETMLAKGQFAPGDVNKRILTMSQLYLSMKNYPKSLQYAERYLKEVGQDPEVSRQIAQTYYIQNDFAKTADIASKYIKANAGGAKPPSEDWYKLWMSSLFKLNRTTEAADVQEQVLGMYPSQAYWEDMFKYVKSESTFNDRQNIIMYRLMDAVGTAKGPTFIEVAELSLASGNPGDAKYFLEKGVNSGELKGEREKKLLAKATADAATDLPMLASIEKEAAGKPTGEPLVKIGEGYLGHRQFEKAIEALSKGLAKGKVSFQDEATINLGIAYLGAQKQAEAIKTFKSVPASSKVARLARLWASYAAKPPAAPVAAPAAKSK
ncbi:MAG TPA: tetratricopeptide repeat protein [Cellvibrionaceae bacterium]